MKFFYQKILFVIVLQFINVSSALIFEAAKLIPNFKFKPLVMYEANGKRYEPTTVNIIEANGYPAETHIINSDGYLLEFHRIPHGIKSGRDPNKFPVILQHGNFQSSADWVLNSPANLSLGFLLADNGYDVWIGNQRGNDYSNKHEKYSISSDKFWDFSFGDIGKYDVPNSIDYIRHYTGHDKVHYISFSLGTTSYFAGMSLRPELSSKVALGIAMGPSVFQDNFINGFAKLIAFTSKLGNIFLKTFGAIPILPQTLASIIHTLLPIFCNPKLDLIGVCINSMHLFFGNDEDLIKKEQIPLITSVAPSPSSFKSWNHVVQLIGSRRFAEYDYGKAKNLEMYGQNTPPDYNLSNVQNPNVLFVGAYDFLAHREDAKLLASKLPNLVEFYLVPYKKFTHLDFSYGREEAYKVYLHAIDLLNNFNY